MATYNVIRRTGTKHEQVVRTGVSEQQINDVRAAERNAIPTGSSAWIEVRKA